MTAPTVSVILPTRDRAELLAMSAGSVLAQTYGDLELIVVDDGSDEDIDAAVRALGDPRARCLRREESGGPAVARNEGLRAARGRYVAFQDSDDEWLLDKLAMQMQALAGAGDDVMCICGLLRRLGRRIRPYLPAPHPRSGELGFAEVAGQPITYTQTWLVPRQVLLEVGGFDERLRVWEDWELLLRLAQRLRIKPLTQPLVLSEQAVDSVTHDNGAFVAAMSQVLEEYGPQLARIRSQRAGLNYIYARQLIQAECMSDARKALLRSIVDRPLQLRAWAVMAASVLGRAFVTYRLQAAATRAVEAGR